MNILGLRLPAIGKEKALTSVDANRGGWFRIFESFAGAWQRNVTVDFNSVLSNHADFACKTLIASDIAKLRVKLVQRDDNGIWTEVTNTSYRVLIKPNHFQTRIQFFESWVISKLQQGNTIALKQRDPNGFVTGLYILDWRCVRPLIADNGDVFYELTTDVLSGLEGPVVVPAREVIHDRFNCLFHPLVGVSPIFAGGIAAMQGKAIQEQATKFFMNASRPGGVLTAPGAISDATAQRLKDAWQANYTGENAGKVAVLGDGLKFEATATNAENAQLIEQLRYSAEVICSVYHVPPYKIGQGTMPTNNNVQSLNVEYYSQALQVLIESIEVLLDEGLGLRGEGGSGANLGTEFDVDNLLRMDSATQMDVLDKGKNVMKPNEARKKINLGPVAGGDAVYRQQQDFSLEALAKRDAKDDPFDPKAPATSISVTTGPAPGELGSEPVTDVQATALNGAQVQALQALLAAVANGELPPETARAAIAAAFPLMSATEIGAMIDPLVDFEPQQDEPAADPGPDGQADDGKALDIDELVHSVTAYGYAAFAEIKPPLQLPAP